MTNKIYKSKKTIVSECIIAFVLAVVLFLIFFTLTKGIIHSIGVAVSFIPLVVIVRNLIRLQKPLVVIEDKMLYYVGFARVSKVESIKIVPIYKKEFFEFKTAQSEIRTELNSFTELDIKRLKSTKLFKKN